MGILEDRSYDLNRVREEMEERWSANRRGHRFLGVCLALLAAGVGVMAWIGYPLLQSNGTAATGVTELSQSVAAVGEQASATQQEIAEWSGRQEQFRAQVTQGLEGLRQRVATTAKQAGETAAALTAGLRTELQTQIGGLTARVSGVEASQKGAQAQIAALEQDLVEARGEISEQTRRLTALRGDVDRQGQQNAGSIAAANRQMAEMEQRQTRDRTDFDAYSARAARQRVDFEVSKGQPREIVPGVSVGVNGTNVDYQRVNGWVSAPDRRTIWLRELRTQEPVLLFSDNDGRTHELVVTRVSRNAVVGYLLVPMDSAATRTVASSAGRGE